MYLLDKISNINNINKIVNKISNINSVNDLTKTFNKKDGLSKIIDKLVINVKLYKNENNINNLKKLFENPPLNSSLPENFVEELNKIDNNTPINNSLFKNILYTYKKEIDKALSNGSIKDKTAYEIVGDIHKTLQSFTYGKRIYHKNNMDELLINIEDSLSLNKEELNNDPILNKKELILDLANKVYDNKIPKDIQELLDNDYYPEAMSEINKHLTEINYLKFENFYSKSLYKIKLQSKTEIYENITKIIQNNNKELLKKYGINFFKLSSSDNLFELIENLKSSKIEAINHIENLKDQIGFSNKIDSIKNDVDLTYEKLISNISHIISLNEKLESSLKLKTNSLLKKHIDIIHQKFPDKNYLELNDMIKVKNESLFKEYQNLNKFLLSDSEYFVNFEKLTKINYSENIKNISLEDRYIYKKNGSKKDLYLEDSVIKTDDFAKNVANVLKIKNLESYPIEDIRAFLLILNSNNKQVYNFYKKNHQGFNFDSNKIIENIFNDQDVLKLPLLEKERIKYFYNVFSIKKDVDKLLIKDINFDIEKFIIDNVPLNKNKIIKETLSKLDSLKDSYKGKENILLMMILESYDKNGFNEDKFKLLNDILKQNHKVIFESPKYQHEISLLKDDWLKWSLIYGREIQDYNLILEKIDPMTFDFAEYMNMKKRFKSIKEENNELFQNIDELNPKYIKFYSLLKKINPEIGYEIFFEHLNIISNIEDKNKYFFGLFEESVKYLLSNNSLNKYSDLFNTESFKSLLNDPNTISNNFKYSKLILNFFNIMIFDKEAKKENSLHSLEQLEKLLNNINTDYVKLFVENFTKFGLEKIAHKTVFTKEAIKFIESYFTRFNDKDAEMKKYIDYYKTKFIDKNTFDLNKLNENLPIISKDIGNGYSYQVKPVNHFDILFTGNKSNCCMTYNNAGWKCIDHMYQNPNNNVIFEVFKNGEPVANSWAWIYNGQLTFDNIEAKTKNGPQDSILKAYLDYSLEASKYDSISKITVGRGYGVGDTQLNKIGTPTSGLINHARNKGAQYTDAGSQFLIFDKNNPAQSMNKFITLLGEDNSLIKEIYSSSNSMSRGRPF